MKFPPINKRIITALKVCISAILLTLFLVWGSSEGVLAAMAQYSLVSLITIWAIYMLSLLIASLRWRLFLKEESLMTLLRYTLVGQLYSFILPGQISGDIVKTFRFMSQRVGDSGRIVSSVLVDKINGLLGVIVLLCLGLLLSPQTNSTIFFVSAFVFGCVLMMVIYLGSSTSWRKKIIWGFSIVKDRYEVVSPIIRQVERGLCTYQSYVRDKFSFALNLLLAGIFQIVLVLMTMVCANSLGIQVSFIDWCWIFGAVSLSSIVPITVAGIGVREGVFIYYLTNLGVTYDSALALSLSILAVQFFAAILGALCELWSLYVPHIRTEKER